MAVIKALLWMLVLASWLPSARLQVAAQETFEADQAWLDRADAARSYIQDSTGIRIDEFIDFSCSTCQDYFVLRADSVKEHLVDSGDVSLIIRAFPLARLMRGFQAWEAAFCAGALNGRQGFEGMQHRLFMNQARWQPLRDPGPVFQELARALGLPAAEFDDCLARDAMAPLILHDIRLGHAVQAPGTPTFVFNQGSEMSGAVKFYGNQPLAEFRAAIEKVSGGV